MAVLHPPTIIMFSVFLLSTSSSENIEVVCCIAMHAIVCLCVQLGVSFYQFKDIATKIYCKFCSVQFNSGVL